MLLWVEFIVCTLVIVYSGTRLAKYGDIIAEKTGLGRAWIGTVLRHNEPFDKRFLERFVSPCIGFA